MDTLEELEKEYRNAVSAYRYYVNTDDHGNWVSETKERNAAREKLNALSAEFKRRGLPTPHCP